jgi:hypothetical protein
MTDCVTVVECNEVEFSSNYKCEYLIEEHIDSKCLQRYNSQNSILFNQFFTAFFTAFQFSVIIFISFLLKTLELMLNIQ